MWTATGLAGLFAHGAWPDGVGFTGAPPALRSLATAPTDLAAAWPATPPAQLSGYGLFWGLLIGEAMILLVLAVFALGTVACWRAVRAQRRAGTYTTPVREPSPNLRKRVRGTPRRYDAITRPPPGKHPSALAPAATDPAPAPAAPATPPEPTRDPALTP